MVRSVERVYLSDLGKQSSLQHGHIHENNRVRIWPNPIAGSETVRVEADGKATVMVYGMNGAMVAETTIDGVGEISTAGLAQGVYIVKVMADSNVKTAKLIVK